jgi:hypothetical protein
MPNVDAWNVVAEGSDLGAWTSRAKLIRQVPWTGLNLDSDRDYLQSLKALASGRIVEVKRPLFVQN